MRECTIEDHFCEQMELAYPTCEIRKFEKKKNDPDRIVFLPDGKVLLIELKKPGEIRRSGQERAAKRFSDLGFYCTWASTKDEVDEIIKYLKKWRGL